MYAKPEDWTQMQLVVSYGTISRKLLWSQNLTTIWNPSFQIWTLQLQVDSVSFVAAYVINFLLIWHILNKFGLKQWEVWSTKMSIISITNYEGIEVFPVTAWVVMSTFLLAEKCGETSMWLLALFLWYAGLET